ncbi:MerR family transcriptional regulator [Actinoplanes sp. LDG1-06]|uniref:MerR family transcriptional regulator n=1 Tax=Paractinoplanes ovalisporus TaxID=2810368 RepID=A0ABS2A9B3_9ACTN|nr:MerR family transcriptional regulator [Actinoplanes ovalisporus]MBM2616427.1 MerR family transcriptional regulator [Actinoplanes ovalisporus]
MRIKELAELTGVTVRTVRYYHQIGLVPVPPTRDGVRDYGMVHVARVVRVRWLAEAGVGLARVGSLLHDPAATPGAARRSVLADLESTVTALDDQIARLGAQRERMRGLMSTVEQGGALSPMPAGIARFYDDIAARATDRPARRAIRRERDFVELAFYRGDMPPEAAVLYEGLTEAAKAHSLHLFGQVAARSGESTAYDDEQVARIAAAVVNRIRDSLGDDLPTVFRSIDLAVARRAAELYLRLSGAHERRVDRAIADALLSAIEKEHQS